MKKTYELGVVKRDWRPYTEVLLDDYMDIQCESEDARGAANIFRDRLAEVVNDVEWTEDDEETKNIVFAILYRLDNEYVDVIEGDVINRSISMIVIRL